MTYGAVFAYCIPRDMIPIGLYPFFFFDLFLFASCFAILSCSYHIKKVYLICGTDTERYQRKMR